MGMSVPNPPRATVRLQFHAGFTLDDARTTVPYYAALGISHVYASPLLAARSGSTHGYDVTDPTRINPELGGLEALRGLVRALREHGMGLVLDIVPNHMAASVENPWWRDLLEWGRDSRYANYFDIDWKIPDPNLRDRVLVPTLSQPRHELLRAGELRLQLDVPRVGDAGRDAGRAPDPPCGDVETDACPRIQIVIGEQRFPLAAPAYADVLGGVDALAGLAGEFERARDGESFAAARRALHEFAQTPTGRAAVDTALARYDSTSPSGRERLEALLSDQPYLLAPWTQAWHRINWRRFFDINELVAIRPDRPEVFEATHALVLDLYAQGLVDGLRIDHIDGLIDPRGYCHRLRGRLRELEPRRPAEAPPGPAWLIVEKILAAGETLRSDWPVDGTTGYEFMDQVGALLHDPAGAEPLAQLWSRLTGAGDYSAQALDARRQMVLENFAADLDATIRAVRAVVERIDGVDIDTEALRTALVELIVHFPVYRTYTDENEAHPLDAAIIASAARAAEASGAAYDRNAMKQLVRWLSGDAPQPAREQAARAITRFQRLTPPVAAKAIEDTMFYRYGRLLSRNEVGAEPDRFALAVDAFHAACAARRCGTPHTLLTTATHDHKRGEDARARLAVLSEISGLWAEQLHAWRSLDSVHRGRNGGGPAPDPADEAMLYQTLVGAWPLDLDVGDTEGVRAFAARIAEWQTKALREAKRHSGWAQPDEAYEEACRLLLDACLSPGSQFLAGLARFVRRIAPAGALNSLVQALLRMTTPGLPDLYQGTEFWDFSLVDPDNRRPVDHAARTASLGDGPLPELIDAWIDGRLKQRLVARVLGVRKALPMLFAEGDYRPLHLRGRQCDRAIAFARARDDAEVAIVAPRLSWPLLGDAGRPHVPPDRWEDTAVELAPGPWRGILDGQSHYSNGAILLGRCLQSAPVALLLRQQSATPAPPPS